MYRTFLLAAILAAGCLGCATVPAIKPPIDDVALQREARGKQAIAQFEQKRDAAQLEAATERYQQGDLPGCRQLLAPLLERNPKLLAARLLSAHLYRDQEEPAAAERELRQALEEFPTAAAVHYELALLLDDRGRAADALTHFRRAAELEPENELYQLSLQALRGPATPPPARR